MPDAYNKREIRKILYNLKKRYGSRLVWNQFSSSDTDIINGTIDVKEEPVIVRKAIIMPEITDRIFHYSLSFLAAGNNFIYGGDYDKESTLVIVDIRDIPKVYRTRKETTNDTVKINDNVYNLKKISDFSHNLALLFVLNRVVS